MSTSVVGQLYQGNGRGRERRWMKDVVTWTFGGDPVSPLIGALSSQCPLSELQVGQHLLPSSLRSPEAG